MPEKKLPFFTPSILLCNVREQTEGVSSNQLNRPFSLKHQSGPDLPTSFTRIIPPPSTGLPAWRGEEVKSKLSEDGFTFATVASFVMCTKVARMWGFPSKIYFILSPVANPMALLPFCHIACQVFKVLFHHQKSRKGDAACSLANPQARERGTFWHLAVAALQNNQPSSSYVPACKDPHCECEVGKRGGNRYIHVVM
jgi:hypothetical protein